MSTSNKPKNRKQELFTTKETASMLGISQSALITWRSRKPDRIPYKKIEGVYFYSLEDIMDFKRKRDEELKPKYDKVSEELEIPLPKSNYRSRVFSPQDLIKEQAAPASEASNVESAQASLPVEEASTPQIKTEFSKCNGRTSPWIAIFLSIALGLVILGKIFEYENRITALETQLYEIIAFNTNE